MGLPCALGDVCRHPWPVPTDAVSSHHSVWQPECLQRLSNAPWGGGIKSSLVENLWFRNHKCGQSGKAEEEIDGDVIRKSHDTNNQIDG